MYYLLNAGVLNNENQAVTARERFKINPITFRTFFLEDITY
jgi:hypothetical protein